MPMPPAAAMTLVIPCSRCGLAWIRPWRRWLGCGDRSRGQPAGPRGCVRTTDTTVRITMDATSAVPAAEEAVRRARHTVEELQETVSLAIRVLQDAEFDSTKSRLPDRGNHHPEVAAEHLGRLQNQCTEMRDLTDELRHHLDRAAGALAVACDRVVALNRDAQPDDSQELGFLLQRLGVLKEMIDLPRPQATLARGHLEEAREASHADTATSLVEPRSLEYSIRAAGRALGRADEDLRVLENAVDRAPRSAPGSPPAWPPR